MISTSNNELQIEHAAMEEGMKGKIHEIRPACCLQEAAALNERAVDNQVPTASEAGAYDSELLFISACLWKTLSSEVIHGRHLVPLPKHVRALERETFSTSCENKLQKWIHRELRGCDSIADASSLQEIKAALQAFMPGITEIQLAGVGLGRDHRIKKTRGPNQKTYHKLKGLICPGMLVEATHGP